MATYYEVKFKDILLDLTDRPDITRWIKASYDAYLHGESKRIGRCGLDSRDMAVDVALLPIGINSEKWVNNICYNLIDDYSENGVEIKDDGHAILNCTFGSKNRNGGIEVAILYLMQFYILGAIYVNVDGMYSELDISKLKSLEFFDLCSIFMLRKRTTAEECEVLFYS